MSRRAWLPMLGVLLVAALVLRTTFFVGLIGWDDVEYRESSARLLSGDLVPRSLFGLRWGLTLPLAAAQALGGEGERVTAVVPMLYSLALIVLVFVLGRRLAGERAGLMAAAVLTILPLDVLAASDVHADLPASVFLAVAMYLALRGERAGPKALLWFSLVGTSLAVATLTKESSLALALVLVAWGVWRGWPLAAGAAALAGFALVLAADMAWLRWVTGDWLYRLSPAVTRLHREHMLMLEPSYTWMLDYLAMLLDPTRGRFAELGGVFYLVLVATVVALRAETPGIREAAVWWGVLLVALSLAPHDLTFTRPLFFHFPRTLQPLVVPFALTVGLGFVALRRARLVPAVFVGFALVCGVGVWAAHFDYRQWAAVARQAAPVIARTPRDVPIVADPTSAALLRSLLPARRASILTTDAGVLPGTGLVLRDPLFIASALHHRRAVPADVLEPPAQWERVAAFERPRRRRLRAWMTAAAPARAAPEQTATLWRVGGEDRRAGVVESVR
jgi:4-amino-4-deoxy-L-arabinose transferase-like glycosyltransferase